jgi:hypothetical protein
MKVVELAPGLWRWTAEREGREVWCIYYEAEHTTLLVDPVVPDERERFFEALDRDVERRGLPVTIVCTSAGHRAAAAALESRYGATVLTAGT